MTREEKELNCLNCRIGDFKQNLCDCYNGFCAKYKGIGTEEDLFKAIEALSAEHKHCWNCKHYEPRYNVCHAPEVVKQVTSKLKTPCDSLLTDDNDNSKEQKSKLDLISRADAIEALSEDVMGGLNYERILQSLPSAEAEQTIRHIENNTKESDLVYRPSAEAEQGEWIKTVDGNGWNEWWVFKCPICGATIEDKQYRSWEYNFCPNCGARMKGGDDE